MLNPRPDRLTPEEARALVEKHGGQRAAARATGVPRTTFQQWLSPERHAEESRRYLAKPGVKEAKGDLARVRYYQRKDEGRCVKCGELALSETRCWDCLNKLEEHRGISI